MMRSTECRRAPQVHRGKLARPSASGRWWFFPLRCRKQVIRSGLAGLIPRGQRGLRKMELAPLKDVQPLTGYIRGGVTALASKKDYPVIVDKSALLFETISISAGVRGTQILL